MLRGIKHRMQCLFYRHVLVTRAESLLGAIRSFFHFVFDCDLTQLVSVPTHNRGNCIDLVLSSSPEAVGSMSVSSNTLLCSDHLLSLILVFCQCQVNLSRC